MMNKKIFVLVSVCLTSFYFAQVGINTNTPNAELTVVQLNNTDSVLKVATLSNNIDRGVSQIQYTKGHRLYIDDTGHVYTNLSAADGIGLSNLFDKKDLVITTTWQTIYTLPNEASIADFKFYTNFSLGAGGAALVAGKVSVGTGTGLSLYDYNSRMGTGVSADEGLSILGNKSNLLTLKYVYNASLLFQLTPSRELQVKLSTIAGNLTNTAMIYIYDSSVMAQ